MLAKKYFDNINMDLMFALPQQSTGDWKKTLDTAVSLAPVHISAYSLIIEEGTPFYAKYTPADDDIDREMYYFAKKFLAENGYRQYEISNFAKDGFKCKHNLVYWQGGDYKGFGIGAASLVDAHRTKNTEDIRSYLNGTTIIEDIPLDTDDMMKEFVILGLRCTEGIDSLEFERRFGKNVFAVFGGVFKKYPDLVYINGSNIRLTSKGTDLSNIVFSDII